MKLNLLNMNEFIRNLVPVTTTELKTKSGEYNENGLFSEKIFGIEGSLDRSKKYSYINLNTIIIHPAIYKLLMRIDRRIEKFLNTEETFSLNSDGELIKDKDGMSGIHQFAEIFDKIKLRGESDTRDQIIKVIKDAYKNKTLFIEYLAVIPPNFRPMYEDQNKNMMIDEMNTIYINILRKASQVKSVGEGSALFKLLNFYLQIAINDHDKFIRTKISKKSGLIRGNMLGKRVDFSARAVIVPGPNLDVNQIGVPLRIAVVLFQPFLIHYILFSKKYPYIKEFEYEISKFMESDLSVDTIDRLIKAIKNGDKIPAKLYNLIFDATKIVMKNRVVLSKRDPALHDGSYGAFYPVLVDGHTIQICTLQVGRFTADFDGDAMALFHPLTNESQEEAKTKMMKGRGSKHSQHITYEISKEMLAGLYTMTKDKPKSNSPLAVTQEMLEKGSDPYIRVKYRGKVTTLGKAIINSIFPPDFDFIDVTLNKKIINGMIPKIIEKYGDDVAVEIFSKIEKIGFKFATIMAPSLTLAMLELPDSILKLKQKIKGSTPEEADKILKEAEKLLIIHLKDTGLYDLIESGSGKGWAQPRQILVAKGVTADTKGNLIDPIEGSFADGLKTTEYFNAASGARKGMADRALNTATTGYFTRQLVYILGPVEADPVLRDCKTKRTVSLRLTNDIIKRIEGRFIIQGNKLNEFNKSQFSIGNSIELRTPIFCESKKICHTCYGKLLLRHKTPYIGILAGTSIGERGTQRIMQTFHTGGAAILTEHDVLQELLDNDPLITISLSKYLKQDKDKLITLKPAKVTVSLLNYKMNDNIQINSDHIWVNHLLAKIEYEDVIFNLVLDYAINFRKINMTLEKNQLALEYTNNDVILEIPLTTEEVKEQINYVNRLLGGKVVYKDPSHMVNKVLKVYGQSVSDLDLVHFEVLISQILRDRSNNRLPARLGKTWNPIMMSIKNGIFSSGFIQGLAFENINKAIEVGLISEDELEPSILGRLITGDISN